MQNINNTKNILFNKWVLYRKSFSSVSTSGFVVTNLEIMYRMSYFSELKPVFAERLLEEYKEHIVHSGQASEDEESILSSPYFKYLINFKKSNIYQKDSDIIIPSKNNIYENARGKYPVNFVSIDDANTNNTFYSLDIKF